MATTRTTTTKSQPKSIAVEPKLEATDVCIIGQQRVFKSGYLLMEASQYPDSAYGDEMYVQPSSFKLLLWKVMLTK